MLDVQATTKGMLVPRMTTGQREAISNVANGLLVYDATTNSFWFFQDNDWQELVGGSVKGNELADEDGDTRVQVEESANDNTIRFDVSGIETMTLQPDGNLQIKGSNPDDAGFMEMSMGIFSGSSGCLAGDLVILTLSLGGGQDLRCDSSHQRAIIQDLQNTCGSVVQEMSASALPLSGIFSFHSVGVTPISCLNTRPK